MSGSVKQAGLKAFAEAVTRSGTSGMMVGIVGRDKVVEEVVVPLPLPLPFAPGEAEAGMMVADGVRDWEGEVRVEVESKLR